MFVLVKVRVVFNIVKLVLYSRPSTVDDCANKMYGNKWSFLFGVGAHWSTKKLRLFVEPNKLKSGHTVTSL